MLSLCERVSTVERRRMGDIKGANKTRLKMTPWHSTLKTKKHNGPSGVPLSGKRENWSVFLLPTQHHDPGLLLTIPEISEV